MNDNQLPLSFVMALAQNEKALEKYNNLNDLQKESILNKTRKINSKSAMQSFVSSLGDDGIVI